MARGQKKIEGQIVFEMSLKSENYVCQANSLITGKQSLKINSAKIIRTAIAQIVREDEEFKPYVITIQELAKLLDVSASNLYRDIDDLTDDIIENPVEIKKEIDPKKPHKTAWIKIPWVSKCEYYPDVGLAITLNNELKPLLLHLQEHYAQYMLEEILIMKSTYSIRIFELLHEQLKYKHLPAGLPKDGAEVELPLTTIRECCDVEDKYTSFSNLRARVIDIAMKEINRVTMYNVTYTYRKEGRTVVSLICNVKSKIPSYYGF